MIAHLNDRSLVTASFERDRRIAERLQRILLRTHPQETLPGLSVETFYEAARDEAEVGGDSFDAFLLTGGRIALCVADASGKGLDAAERVAEVRFALRAFLREHDDPCQALTCLNDFVCTSQHLGERDCGTFLTLSLVVLDSASGEMTCLCAGGEPPIALRSCGTATPIPICGTALGLCAGLSYEAARCHLAPGDTVLLATDGITEARHLFPDNPVGSRRSAFLGEEGLLQLARQAGKVSSPHHASSLRQMGRTIFEGARAFAGGAFHDDACLLLARRETPLTARAPSERFSGGAGMVR